MVSKKELQLFSFYIIISRFSYNTEKENITV